MELKERASDDEKSGQMTGGKAGQGGTPPTRSSLTPIMCLAVAPLPAGAEWEDEAKFLLAYVSQPRLGPKSILSKLL